MSRAASILDLTGHVDLGPEPLLTDLERAMADEGIASSGLDASDVRAVMPELRLMPGERALHHREGGTVLARAGMEAMARAATGLGASLISPERVVSLETSGDGVRLVTTGRRIDAGVAVVATGPWANELLTPLGIGPAARTGRRPGDLLRHSRPG